MTSTKQALHSALKVLVLNSVIQAYLAAHDPMALKQAVAALEAADREPSTKEAELSRVLRDLEKARADIADMRANWGELWDCLSDEGVSLAEARGLSPNMYA